MTGLQQKLLTMGLIEGDKHGSPEMYKIWQWKTFRDKQFSRTASAGVIVAFSKGAEIHPRLTELGSGRHLDISERLTMP